MGDIILIEVATSLTPMVSCWNTPLLLYYEGTSKRK